MKRPADPAMSARAREPSLLTVEAMVDRYGMLYRGSHDRRAAFLSLAPPSRPLRAGPDPPPDPTWKPASSPHKLATGSAAPWTVRATRSISGPVCLGVMG